MNSEQDYQRYQEWLKSYRSDFASDIGLLATATLVMPIESKPSVNRFSPESQHPTPEATSLNEHPELKSQIARLAITDNYSHIQALENAITPTYIEVSQSAA